MRRTADYTIQGFLYQFNLTLFELLNASDDAEITIEGIIEDIEIETLSEIRAIQCKYHETKEDYSESILYYPLLQMMKNFKLNPNAKIKYHLFAHFPKVSNIEISSVVLDNALNSENRKLEKLIKDVSGVDVNKFLDVFTIKVTPKYDDLVAQNIELLTKQNFDKKDIETLVYPNAIHIISERSIKHDEKYRKITKKSFFENLRQIKTTAISQWTLALKNRNEILRARRNQLRKNLNENVRLRFLVIFPDSLDQFDNEIVLFIKEYINKYHFKQVHTCTPIFVIDVKEDSFYNIAERLVGKGIVPNIGRAVNVFSENYFFREPMVVKNKKEFVLRLICWNDYRNINPKVKPDDFFVIGKGNIEHLDLQDVNIETLDTEKFDEIKYIMGMSNAY